MFKDIPSAKRGRRVNKQAVLLWGLMFVVAIPGGFLFWQHRNQTRAQANLEEMNAALSTYFEKFHGYPDTLKVLRGRGKERRTERSEERGNEEVPMGQPEHARLLPTELALDSFETGGYRYHYRPRRPVHRWAASVPLSLEYELTATPANAYTGRVHLATDETGEVLDARSADDLAEELERRAEAARLAREAAEGEEGKEDSPGVTVTATPAAEDDGQE